MAEEDNINLIDMRGGWKKEIVEIATALHRFTEEVVENEMGKVDMMELRGALDKEKLERQQENGGLENNIEGRLVSERKKIEDELNSLKVDIRSMTTWGRRPLSSAASTGYGPGLGIFLSHQRVRDGKVSGLPER